MMMNDTDALYSINEYRELLEEQRLILAGLLEPCSGSPCGAEPHAYHSDDTFGDLTAALEIYAALLEVYDESMGTFGQGLELLMREWYSQDQLSYGLERAGQPLPLDDEDIFPPFSCDGVSALLHTLYLRYHHEVQKNYDPDAGRREQWEEPEG